MGGRQSRRSVDITPTPKKEGLPADGSVGDAAAPGDGKLERIEETDTKPTTNGIAPHTDSTEDKDKDKDETTEKEKDKEKQEEVKAEETKQESAGESPAETTAEVTTPTEPTAASPNTTATSPESKETKKKEKMKKKWSFRSISFSKKDKNKPAREEAPKNGDVTKEEILTEGGEEAENGSATAGSPVEEKSAVSSPSAETEAAPASAAPSTETKEDAAATGASATATAASSPADEKQEEPTPSAPTPVPVEENKEEVEKIGVEKRVVEVSPAGRQFVPVEVSIFRVQTVDTPSIIERKTSEDTPSLPPSSPPPTPIDPSPLQQAQQAAASATALAEALKLPAEAADKDFIAPTAATATLSSSCPERNDPPTPPPADSLDVSPQRPPGSSPDRPHTEPTPAPPKLEALPVVDTVVVANNPEVAVQQNYSDSPSSTDVTAQKSENVDETPLPVAITDATNSSPDAPAKQQQEDTTLSERNEQKEAVKEVPPPPPLEKKIEANAEETHEIEVTETIEIPASSEAVAVVAEKTEVVEQLVESNAVCDASSAPVEDIKPPPLETTVAEDSAQPEQPVECRREDTPPIDLAGRVEESVEEIVVVEEVVQEETIPAQEIVIDPPITVSDMILETEEGPMPLSEEIVVEAKPAVVIPEDEETVEETADTDADVSKVDTESVEVIPDIEDKLETEMDADIVVPAEEEELVADEPEDFPPNEATIDPVQPVTETIVIIEDAVKKVTEVIEVLEEDEDSMPPPVPESPMPGPWETFTAEMINIRDDATTAVPSPIVDVEPQIVEAERSQEVEKPSSQTEQIEQTEVPEEYSRSDVPPSPLVDTPEVSTNSPSCSLNEQPMPDANESQTQSSPSRLEPVSSDPTDDHPPPAPRGIVQSTDSFEYPLPPEELSCPLMTSSNVSETKSEIPVPDENVPSLRNPTETLLTPPRSPSPQSNISITSGLTTSTKDSSQTQFYDDQSNREFKMESVSISLNSYNESDIELKERLAESLAETENQEESSVSCQLSNNATSSTTVQETHQTTPESEAPVENNVAHDSTTESSEEKIAPPAVLTEIPASPPSAPAITEDVASVAKAIEEIDISDKAVAAATIECTTNEIIADAHYQNNVNE
ncbi:PREDICTED: cell surface glycoprotein 1-like [Dufourea novaeangliae]|uniref:cell surface glycoprotein 1-like n=1 Tax=Dufourea novaeangliae TaxID=178035 RepID=UPI00076736AC|nr:PREDICTED: cell surface glycoprotein 1-like [Dufourea novaeangliae]XP_015436956.1 PREDICTED: cell surface glycoprotein 1-like [Dufourea novaeangliae]